MYNNNNRNRRQMFLKKSKIKRQIASKRIAKLIYRCNKNTWHPQNTRRSSSERRLHVWGVKREVSEKK